MTAVKKTQDYENDGILNQTGGQDSSPNVKDQLKTLAGFVQNKMKSNGSLDQQELKTMFAKAGLDISPNVDKFNELDANKNGKIEQSEVNPQTNGEDSTPDCPECGDYSVTKYFRPWLYDGSYV